MSRIARLVVLGLPHHVTQRGNRREPVFFSEADYGAYLDLLRFYAPKSGARLIGWSLMPNHVHLIAVPTHTYGLRALLGKVYRRYTARIKALNRCTRHLWQGRFGSVVLDAADQAHAMRQVALNPVRAGLLQSTMDRLWASTRAQFERKPDGRLTDLKAGRSRFADLAELLACAEDAIASNALRRAETSGRRFSVLGWIAALEAATGRALQPRRRG